MRSLKYLISGLIVVLFMHGSAFATATPTATATASPSPTATAPAAASTPAPTGTTFSGATHFGYLGTVSKSNGLLGGYIVQLTATAALLYGQVVVPDSANNNSVVVAASGATNPIGVVVGCVGGTAANPAPGLKFGCNPAAAQKAIVLIDGVASVVCDANYAAAQVVMTSTIVNGMVGAYVAGTVDEQIGVLLNSCVANGTANLLVYK
jgi:hypothetical protein